MVIHSETGYFTDEINNKYLIFDSLFKSEKVWSEVKVKIKRINSGLNLFHKKKKKITLSRIKVDADDF